MRNVLISTILIGGLSVNQEAKAQIFDGSVGQLPNAQPSVGQLPNAQPSVGQLPNAQPSVGQLPNAQPSVGQLPNAQPSVGQLPNAQPSVGQLPNAQPSVGQLPNAQLQGFDNELWSSILVNGSTPSAAEASQEIRELGFDVSVANEIVALTQLDPVKDLTHAVAEEFLNEGAAKEIPPVVDLLATISIVFDPKDLLNVKNTSELLAKMREKGLRRDNDKFYIIDRDDRLDPKEFVAGSFGQYSPDIPDELRLEILSQINSLSNETRSQVVNATALLIDPSGNMQVTAVGDTMVFKPVDELEPFLGKGLICEPNMKSQPVLGKCSSVLVNHPERGIGVMTAAHCVKNIREPGHPPIYAVFDYEGTDWFNPDDPQFSSARYAVLNSSDDSVFIHPNLDIAFVKISDYRNLPKAVEVSLGDQINLGDRIFAIGYPFGRPRTVVVGPDTEIEDFDQYEIRSYIDNFSKNSGSPIFDFDGRLQGILYAQKDPDDFDLIDGPGSCVIEVKVLSSASETETIRIIRAATMLD